MKFILLVILISSFASCVTFKQYDNRAVAAKEENYTVALIKNDGTIIKGDKLKCKNIHPQEPNLAFVINKDKAFSLDGQNYNDQDVVAFQDKRGYHKRIENYYLMRLYKGKMNLYYFDNINTTKTSNARKSVFYFEKENNKLVVIGLAELKEAMKDNASALAKLNTYYPKNDYRKELDIEKLITVFKLYNE